MHFSECQLHFLAPPHGCCQGLREEWCPQFKTVFPTLFTALDLMLQPGIVIIYVIFGSYKSDFCVNSCSIWCSCIENDCWRVLFSYLVCLFPLPSYWFKVYLYHFLLHVKELYCQSFLITSLHLMSLVYFIYNEIKMLR